MQLRASQLRNPSTMDFPFWNPTNSELQVPATHASRAHQAPRFVQSLSGCWPGAALFDPTRSYTPLYNHQAARKESHFHTGMANGSLAVGSQGHFNVTSHRGDLRDNCCSETGSQGHFNVTSHRKSGQDSFNQFHQDLGLQ